MKVDWSFLEPFQIESYDEAVAVLQDMEIELLKLVKKLKSALKQMGQALHTKLGQQLKKMGNMLADAFTVDSMEEYAQAAAIYGTQLAGSLYGLQVKLAQFRLALVRAAEPIVRLLVPVAKAAVEALTGLANAVAYTLNMLFFGTEQAEDMAQGITNISSAGKSLKRTLASFDQLNRLGSETAGTWGAAFSEAPLTGKWKKLAETLTELFRPFQEFDLSSAAESLKKLVQALEPIKKELFSGLQWAWDNLLVPLAQWTAEELLPIFLDTLTAALQALGHIITELKPTFTWLWESCLQPLAQWAGDKVVDYLQAIADKLQGVSGWITDNRDPVAEMIASAKTFLETIGSLALKTMGFDAVTQNAHISFGSMLGSLISANTPLGNLVTAIMGVTEATDILADSFQTVDTASNDTWEGIQSIWGNLWQYLKTEMSDPTYKGMKSSANNLIGLLNGVLEATTKGVNYITGSINGLSFTVPDWIPVLGGNKFQFNLKKIDPMQIPLLAQGAVLPANKPFMAIVGDQRHGTNIEAPLTTIEEAVANVMQYQLGGIMAGFEAVTHRQEKILEAIMGIDLSDGAIAAAAERYQEKMSIVMGGY